MEKMIVLLSAGIVFAISIPAWVKWFPMLADANITISTSATDQAANARIKRIQHNHDSLIVWLPFEVREYPRQPFRTVSAVAERQKISDRLTLAELHSTILMHSAPQRFD